MSEQTKFRMTTALLKHGQARLAEHLEISPTELSKKINGENGWKTEQIAKAFDFAGIQILPAEEELMVVKRDEWLALRTLARKSLEPLDD